MSSVFSVYRNEWSKNNHSTLPLPPLKLPYVSRKKKPLNSSLVSSAALYGARTNIGLLPTSRRLHRLLSKDTLLKLYLETFLLSTPTVSCMTGLGGFFSILFFFFPSSLAFLINSFPSLHGPNRTHPHCS